MESMTDTNAHPSSRRYPPEIKERAVRMVQETMERNGNVQGVVSRVARQLGIGVESCAPGSGRPRSTAAQEPA